MYFPQLLILSFFLISCQDTYQSTISNNKSNNHTSNFFIKANKQIIKNEELKIDSLLSSSNQRFIKDSTGIWINIEKENKKENKVRPLEGDIVKILYDCVILEDINNLEYEHMVDTIMFQIGYSKQMRGLNYAIKLLEIGDKAKIIIPSYLGFGMSGYGRTVPPYSTLLLNVKLLNIES